MRVASLPARAWHWPGVALLAAGCATAPPVGPHSPPRAPQSATSAAASAPEPAPAPAAATTAPAASPLRLADEAYAAGELDRARELYRAALAAQPNQSRAVFRLGQLAEPGSAKALRRFRQYVTLEPRDPWGQMALGDALARAGDVDTALAQYEQARRLAPNEPDVVAGTARILQQDGRTDALIALYEAQIAQRPGDAVAWIELGRARQRGARHAEAARAYARAHNQTPDPRTLERLDAALAEAAPSLRPYLGSGRDSDDNRVTRGGLELLLPAGDRARMGVRAERADISDPSSSGTADTFALVGTWAPLHAVRIEAAGGVTRLRSPTGTEDDRAAGRLRLRWRESHRSPGLDLQAQRRPLLATPGLLAAPVDLTEARGSIDVPMTSAFALRLGGQAARLEEPSATNSRAGGRIALVHRASPTWETQASASVLGYEQSSSAGYFAPRRIEALELGTYFEYYAFWPLTIAVDAGIGVQRVTPFAEPARAWQGALRAWTSFAWDLQPGVQLALEIDFENSLAATAATTTSEDWRAMTALVSLRFGVLRRSAQQMLNEARRSR